MTPILHLTHGANLANIIAAGGLWSTNHRPARVSLERSIAYDHIQSRRARTQVPCGLGGVLHDYVPFYFGERSPMLYANHTGRVAANPEGQRPLVYLVSSVEAVVGAGLQFVFTDGHAEMRPLTSYFDTLGELAHVDWPTTHARWWKDTSDDPDRCRRKQAEFLVYRFFPWRLVAEVVVIDESVRAAVEQQLARSPHSVSVRIDSGWYY
jgi:hypothetical protein